MQARKVPVEDEPRLPVDWGQANMEVADKLPISERTKKFQVSSLLENFGVRCGTDLILLCFQDRHPCLNCTQVQDDSLCQNWSLHPL